MKKIFLIVIFCCTWHIATLAQINVPYWLNTGHEKIIDSDNLGAVEALNIIVRHHPDVADAFLLRGIAKYNLNDYRGAISDFSAAIAISAVYSDYFLYRGQAKERIYDYAGSREDYNKAIELRPFSVDAYLCRGINSLIIKKYEDAIADFNNALLYDKKSMHAQLYKAVALQALAKYDEALVCFNTAIKLNVKNSDSYIRRGKLFAETKKYKEAIADFNYALQLSPLNLYAYFNRALARCELEEFIGAMNDFNRVIELDPQNDITYYNRAALKTKNGDLKGAIDDYNKVVELNPSNVYTFFNRGVTWHQLDNYKKAIDDYSKAIQLNPDFAIAYLNRALAREKIKDLKGAYTDYEMAKKLNASPDSLRNIGALDSAGMAKIIEFQADFAGSNVNFAPGTASSGLILQNFLNYYFPKPLLSSFKEDIYTIDQKWPLAHNSADKVVLSCLEHVLHTDTARQIISEIDNWLFNNGKASDSASWLLLARAILLAQMQQFDLAIESLEPLLYKQNVKAKALFEIANIRFEKIKYISSIDDFYDNLNVVGSSTTTQASTPAGKPDKDFSHVIDEYRECVRLEPRNKYVLFNLGNVLIEAGEFGAAIDAFSNAIVVSNNFGIAYYNRGLTYLYIGEKNEGCANLSKAGELGVAKAYETIKKLCN